MDIILRQSSMAVKQSTSILTCDKDAWNKGKDWDAQERLYFESWFKNWKLLEFDPENFNSYCFEISLLFNELLLWCLMSPYRGIEMLCWRRAEERGNRKLWAHCHCIGTAGRKKEVRKKKQKTSTHFPKSCHNCTSVTKKRSKCSL